LAASVSAGHVLVTVEGVIVEVHLGIERDDVARTGDDQRVDFDQRGVEIDIGLVEIAQQRGEGADLLAAEAQRERDLAALKGLVAGSRVDRLGDDLLGRLMRHGLDIHAALGRGDDGDAADGAIHQHRQVQLAFDVAAVLDVEALHGAARRAGLLGHQVLAQHRRGLRADVLGRLGDADTALALRIILEVALAAPTGMDLRLHDRDGPAQLAGDVHRLVFGVGDTALQQGDGEFGQERLGLILVDIHGVLSLGRRLNRGPSVFKRN